MFDIGWVELLFIAVLALLIVGPKDMPKLLRTLGRVAGRARKVYTGLFQSMKRLEQEVDLATEGADQRSNWRDHLPESVRNLPDDFTPGAMSAEQHQSRRAEFDRVRRKNATSDQQESGAESGTETKHNDHV